MRRGEVSCRELADLYIGRIHEHNPRLHALVVHNEADVLRTARERDDELTRGLVRGPLHGVPVTVKEAFDIGGLPTTANFPRFRNNVAGSDALVVRRLKASGATILGKTNVPMMLADYQCFGPLYPAAANPHNPACTPGGSTGGGAAAVAAGLTALEIGSDLGGSIRVPAHFCGVFALKPTENFAAHGEGHVPPPPTNGSGFAAMVSIGPLARTMNDIETAWRMINPPNWEHPLSVPQRPRVKKELGEYRIAWFDDAGTAACGDETRKALGGLLRILQEHGVTIEKRPFDRAWLKEAYEVWTALLGFMVGQFAPWIVRQVLKYQFSRSGRGGAMRLAGPWKTGMALRFKDFSRILGRRSDLIRHFETHLHEWDFMVSPVAAGPAFPHNPGRRPIELDGRATPYFDYALPYTTIYNACGNPALVVPAGLSADGLPIGVQIAARNYAEPELIHFGKLLEGAGVRSFRPQGY